MINKHVVQPSRSSAADTVANVSLQGLLNHTKSRIVNYQKEAIATALNIQPSDFLSAELILSYGFDGSTGQANYYQAYTNDQSQDADSSLFATTVMPLRLKLLKM